ncbi:MAG: tetratricopeptide repeat protein [Gemmatimonadaceae bacterium]
MIRHQVYFDTLGSMKEDSAAWRSVFAGLSVLRLVDAYVDSGSPIDPGGWAQLHSVRSAIEAVSEGDPIRGVLMAVFEEATNRGAIDETVCTALLAYGRALDYEASWGLAADVFSTVAKLARPEKNPKLAVEAHVAVGGAARRNGDWETSARAYSQAAYIADTVGDRQGVLTVQVGIANNYLAKGNLPQAESILDDVIMQARDQGLSDIQGMALHSRATAAQRKGEKEEAVKLAYEALGLTAKPALRDAVLEDLAVAFSELGMRDAARDAHLLLAATAQIKFVRWQATINLLELASVDGMEQAFEGYAAELRRAPLGTWLRAHFLLFLGEGLERFGRYEAAEQAFGEAVAYANANQIHSVTFKAEDGMEHVRAKAQRECSVPILTQLPAEVLAAAHSISELRKAALTPA